MAFSDFARGLRDVLQAAVRHCGAALAAARLGVGLASLALSLVMLCGLISPASAQSEVTINGSRSGVGWNDLYYYLNNGVLYGEVPGMGTGYEVAYFTFSIPANRSFTSVKLRYSYQLHSSVVHPINFVSLSGPPSVNAAGQDAVQAGTAIASVPSNNAADVALPGAFLSQMNVLSASGGGTMTIGAWGPEGVDYFGEFTSASLIGVAPLPPTISSLSPSSGPLSGGAATLQGTNFESPILTVDGVSVTPTTVTATTIGFILPAHAAGAAVVQVATAGGTATVNHTYVAAPTVASVSPTAGPTGGGQTVIITGTGFAVAPPTGAVKFGASNATYTINSNTQITATTPANAAGTYDVTVTTPGGTSATSAADQFTYVGAPTVTSISPTEGPSTGGTTVTITGTGFAAAPPTGAVKFGASNATYTINSNTQITATTPANAAGTYDVTVTTVGGTSATSAADQFTYVAAPTVTSISPTAGPTSGGTTVIITGTGFSDATAVTFGGTATGYIVNSATQITATAPAGSPGTVDVRVTTAGGTSATSAADQFTYVAAPTVTSISPTAGPTSGGTTVTITGTNFSGATAVRFGATAATGYLVNSATQITATAPAGTGTVDIRVTTVGGTSATSAADQFTYVGAPTVTSISPTAGPTGGGTTVIITGTGFSGATAVTFGGTAATGYTVISATQITATAPAGSPGTVDVRVTTTGGTSATSAADRFTYVAAPTVTSISPTAGPTSGGTTVTITGTNFSGATAVTFGGTATAYTIVSGSSITATAPAGTGTVDIRVTTVGGTSATSAADQFTYVGAPTVSSVSPTAGPSTGGTTVTITGTNFSGATAVTFGGTAASYTVNSAMQITATAPAGSPGTVDVRVTTAGGTSATSAADQFTYVAAPITGAASATVAFESSANPITLSFSGGPVSSVAVATPPTFGSVMVSGLSLSYTPVPGYFGPDSFTYTATGPGGTSAPATVTVTVMPPSAPVAAGASAAVGYETAQAIDLSGSITGIYSSIAVGTAPAHGAVSVAGYVIAYTPENGYFGADSFTYTATGPGGTSAPATVTVTVATPSAPVASPASAVVGYETPQAIDLSGSITGVHTSITVGIAPAHGAVSVAGDVITYTPAARYFGADSFTYTATGPGGTSAPATVTVTVATPPAPVIEQPTDPVVVPPSYGGSIPVDLGAVSQGAVDGYRITADSQFGLAEIINGAALAPMQASASAAPQAAGPYQLVYTPAANFMGTDTVTVVAYGPGGDSAPVTFTFQVAGKAPDLTGQVTAGASVTFTPTVALVGGPFQALRIMRAPDFGTATVNGLSIVFAPGANGGATSLDYVIDLPFGASAPGRIDLTANALPGSEALVAQTLQGVPVTVRISDVEGGPFTGAAVVSMAPSTAGEATIAKFGNDYDLTFVSTGDFSGEAVVTYSLSNAFGTTRSTLTITVEARPDPSLDPEVRGVATSQVTSARRFADAQINNFQQRLRDLHDGTNGWSNGLNLNLGLGSADADRDPQQALRRQLGQDRSLDPGALGGDRDREMLGLDLWAGRAQTAAPASASDDRLKAAPRSVEGAGAVGLWTSGSVDWGRQDATGQRDSRFTTQGATLGLDVKVSDQLIIGGGVGYGEDKTRIGDKGSVTHGKAVTGALYASWRPAQDFYVDGVFGFASLDFTSRRWVEGLAGQADGYADGDRSGDVRFASGAFGRVLRGERLTSDFYARLDARDITLDGFTETGGGLSALNWDKIEQNSLSTNLGASWRWTLDSRRLGQFRPTARVEWSHELEDIGAQGVRYADWTTSPTYLVPLNAWSRDVLNLDLGTEWSVSDRLMLSLGYRGTFGDASTNHGAQIGLKYGW